MSTCGTRALAMIALLARENYPSALRIGIRRDMDGQLSAHAWVVNEEGRVISESAEQLVYHLRVRVPGSSR
jgi:hypothetical protein